MIALIVGTNRPGSKTAKVAAHVADIYTALGQPPQIVDLHQLPPEIFSPSSYEEEPASFAPFQEAILKAEGVVIVIPEYNGSMPGVFKYFLDMLEFPKSFAGTPVAFVGVAAGIWGALRPIEHIEDILIYRHAIIYPVRVNIVKVHDHLDDKDRVKTPEHVGRLEKQAKGFIEFVARNTKK